MRKAAAHEVNFKRCGAKSLCQQAGRIAASQEARKVAAVFIIEKDHSLPAETTAVLELKTFIEKANKGRMIFLQV